MLEDGIALCTQLFRTDGDAHLDVFDFPFRPCAAVHPHTAVLQPRRLGLFLQVDGGEDGIRTLAVRAVRVGQVAGYVDLVRLHGTDELPHDVHVGLAHRQLLDLARLIERQVEEVDVIERNLVEGAGRARLAAADQPLDGADILCVDVAFFLVLQELLYLLVLRLDDLVLLVAEELVETVDEVHETHDLLVADGDVARCLVGDVYVVALLDKAAERTAHGDHVVVRVRREDDDPLRERPGTLRAVGVVGIRLAARPSGDSMLEVVEYLDVGVVGRAVEGQKFAEAVLVVVLVGQLEDRLARHLAEPDECRTDELVGPLAGSDEPGVLDARQLGCRREVDNDVRIVVRLQERGRDSVADLAFYGLLDDVGLLLAPCRKEDPACGEDGAHAHRDGTGRDRLLRAEAHLHLLARRLVDEDEA